MISKSRQFSAMGLIVGLVVFGASSLPNLGIAQEHVNPVSEWRIATAKGSAPKFIQNNYCAGASWRSGSAEPVKVGVSYQFTQDQPSFLDLTAALISNPSEAVAKREVYAVDLQHLSTDSWEQVVRQAEASSDRGLRLSVIMTTDHGYVGTPVKWDQGASDAIAKSLAFSKFGGFEQNELAKAYASEIVASSLETFDTVRNSTIDEIEGAARATSYFCGHNIGAGSELTDAKIYIGFSFRPEISGVAVQPLTTISGVGGELLGSEVPSWPFADE